MCDRKLIATVSTVAEARGKQKAANDLMGEGNYTISLSGDWNELDGNPIFRSDSWRVVSLCQTYVVVSDSNTYAEIKVKPSSTKSKWGKPEIKFYV
jgi:hypothetical protein